RPEPEGLLVERGDDGAFVVRGRPAERAVAVSDLTNAQALDYVQHRLRRLGVDRALARAGAREGDLVRIGGGSVPYGPAPGPSPPVSPRWACRETGPATWPPCRPSPPWARSGSWPSMPLSCRATAW